MCVVSLIFLIRRIIIGLIILPIVQIIMDVGIGLMALYWSCWTQGHFDMVVGEERDNYCPHDFEAWSNSPD